MRKRDYIKTKKNLFPTLVITGILWILLAIIVLYIEPESSLIIIVFLFNLFTVCMFSFSLLLNNTRRGVIISCAVLAFLLLGLIKLANLLNLVLIAGTVIAFEIYFHKNS